MQAIETNVSVADEKIENLSTRLAGLEQEWAFVSSIRKDADEIRSETSKTVKKLTEFEARVDEQSYLLWYSRRACGDMVTV